MSSTPLSTAPANADFWNITNAVPALISFFDAGHVCRFANDHHRNWYGREPSELVGLHMRDFLGDEAYRSRADHLARVASGEIVAFDAAVPHRTDGVRDASIRYVPKRRDNGLFDGFYVLVFDTARHQFRFRSIFDAMAVSFWEMDFSGVAVMLKALRDKGIKDLRAHAARHPEFIREAIDATITLDVNDKSLELFGATSKDELLGSVGRFWPRGSEQVFAESLFASLERAPRFEAETQFVRLNGSEFDALFTCAFPTSSVARASFTVGIVDISSRVQAQQALAGARAELAHAARVATLGELTASIAHEVNQPLAAIVTNGEAAKRWLGQGEAGVGEALAAINRMIEEGTRASAIIARVRALAQKRETERTRFAPNAMIDEAAAIVAHELSQHRVRLRLDLAPDVPEIVADRIQIQQVLINLLINAAQAMDQVPAEARDLLVSSRKADDHLVVDVIDSGPGIVPAEADRLFNAFFSTKESGMGMGLSIAKSIIEAHNGKIAADAAPGGGALFRFTLPIP